jgi:purine/pyrimidine-nucleoside phosphorylase
MLKVNKYFKGTVASIGFANTDGTATIGVMEPGDYEFHTATIEYMTVISGSLTVQLPGSDTWKMYRKGETFSIPKDRKFKVDVVEPTAYSCFYI